MPVQLVVLRLECRRMMFSLKKTTHARAHPTDLISLTGANCEVVFFCHLFLASDERAFAGGAEHLVRDLSDQAGLPMSVILWGFVLRLCGGSQ